MDGDGLLESFSLRHRPSDRSDDERTIHLGNQVKKVLLFDQSQSLPPLLLLGNWPVTISVQPPLVQQHERHKKRERDHQDGLGVQLIN
mmetsp:Transcript_11157/g.18401  ORF Transcript_11157/g.18401 Transcript_11157/m.18401 type:complete len:88 (-) Transcript_11157:110-373(-)